MFNKRIGFFETNSSSCHALMIPHDQKRSKSKVLDLTEDSTSGLNLRKLINELHGEAAEQIVNLLYLNGVETIKYTGRNEDFKKFIESAKNDPQDLGVPKIYGLYDWNKMDWINAFLGLENWDYYGMDGDLSCYNDASYIIDYQEH